MSTHKDGFDPQDVYELRPPEAFFEGLVRRYADGLWIPDDGEWDMAFIGQAAAREADTGSRFAYPCCLYYSPPYHENCVWSWLTGHWTGFVAGHPRGNPWHYSLREGAMDWGKPSGRDGHPNYKAGREGMSKVSSEQGCANGSHAEFHRVNPIILAGLFRRTADKAIVTVPERPICMYCGLSWVELEREAEAV